MSSTPLDHAFDEKAIFFPERPEYSVSLFAKQNGELEILFQYFIFAFHTNQKEEYYLVET